MDKIHHIGIAVESIEKSISFYINFLGMQQISSIVDDKQLKVKVVLLAPSSNPSTWIELVEELETPSPITNVLKQKNRLYHICFEVPDINTALEEARNNKALIIVKPTPAVLFDGRKVAFIFTSDRYIIEFLEKAK